MFGKNGSKFSNAWNPTFAKGYGGQANDVGSFEFFQSLEKQSKIFQGLETSRSVDEADRKTLYPQTVTGLITFLQKRS